jgi:hypothetical protein
VQLEDFGVVKAERSYWVKDVEDHRELTQRLSHQVVVLLSALCLLRCCLRPKAETLARLIAPTATHCDQTLVD